MRLQQFDSAKANAALRAYALAHRAEKAVLKSGQKIVIVRDYRAMVSDKCYLVLCDGQQIAEARLYGAHSGFLDLDRGVGNVSRVQVEPSFQRLGVATALYDVIKLDLARINAVLEPSESYSLSDDAQKFWTDRLGIPPQDYLDDLKLKSLEKVLQEQKPKSILARLFRR